MKSRLQITFPSSIKYSSYSRRDFEDPRSGSKLLGFLCNIIIVIRAFLLGFEGYEMKWWLLSSAVVVLIRFVGGERWGGKKKDGAG